MLALLTMLVAMSVGNADIRPLLREQGFEGPINGRVGVYDTSMPTECKVRGHKVVCNTEMPGVVEFTKRGPPKRIWFDGMVEQIALGNKMKK